MMDSSDKEAELLVKPTNPPMPQDDNESSSDTLSTSIDVSTYADFEELYDLSPDNKRFITAVVDGDIESVKLCLESGILSNTRDSFGNTPLHLAIGNLSLVEILLMHNVDVGATNKAGRTPLHTAAEQGDSETIKQLIINQADVNVRDKFGRTPLYDAVTRGRFESMKLLITNQADVNVKTKVGKTPLHVAAIGGHFENIDLLVSNKADVNAKDKDGITPLHNAFCWGYLQAAELLLKNDADIRETDGKGVTILHYAVQRNWISIAEKLLMLKADVQAKDINDRTPLHWAAERGHLQSMKLLLQSEVDINARDKDGKTALHDASYSGDVEAVELLLTYHANINAADQKGNTPLHLAAYYGYLSIVEKLLICRARYCTNEKGQTPFDLSLSEESYEPEYEDYEGKTYYHYQKMMKEVQRCLRNYEVKALLDDNLRDVSLETVDDFLEIMQVGTYKCYWNRVYLVGPYAVGKSTLAKILVGDPLPIGRESTDSIWIYIGRAGMDIKERKWIVFPIENAFKDVLASMLMSLTARKQPTGNKRTVGIEKETASDEEMAELAYLADEISTIKSVKGTQFSIVDHENVTSDSNTSSEHRIELHGSVPAVSTAMNPRIGHDKESLKHKIRSSLTQEKIYQLVIKAFLDGKYKTNVIPIDIWDFGGQKDYYMTHQLFITSRGIFVLMFNGSVDLHKPIPELSFLPGHIGQPTVAVYLLHWVNSILTYAKRSKDGFPRIIFVATHKDVILKENRDAHQLNLEISLESIFKEHAGRCHLEFKPLIFVNAREYSDPGIDVLRDLLIIRALQHPKWGEQRPTAWVPLELQIAELVDNGVAIISREQLEILNAENKSMELTKTQIDTFLKIQHSLGKLLYFDEAKLRDLIIIKPTYMIEVLRSIVTEKEFWPKSERYLKILQMLQDTGIIERENLYLLWSQEVFRHILPFREYMLEILVHLDILIAQQTSLEDTIPLPDLTHFLVPCMINTPNNTDYLKKWNSKTSIIMAYAFNEKVIPPALVYRFVSSLATMWDLKMVDGRQMIYSDLSVVEVDENHDVTVHVTENRLVVSLIHGQSIEKIVPSLAASIQECLTTAVYRISKFYSALTDDVRVGKSNAEIHHVMPFEIEFGVFCEGLLRKSTICYIPYKKIPTAGHQKWTCPHKKKHDTRFISLWFSDKIPSACCPDKCKGLGQFEMEQYPSNMHLRRLASSLSPSDCRRLFVALGLDVNLWESLEYQFQHQHPDNLKFMAVLKWKQKHRTASFLQLIHAMNECEIDQHTLCQVFRDVNPDTTGITEEILNKTPSNSTLKQLANYIGNDSMQLAIELGLQVSEIEQIQYEHRNKLLQQTKEIFRRWRKQQYPKPSVLTLIKVLHRIGKMDCLREVSF